MILRVKPIIIPESLNGSFGDVGKQLVRRWQFVVLAGRAKLKESLWRFSYHGESLLLPRVDCHVNAARNGYQHRELR